MLHGTLATNWAIASAKVVPWLGRRPRARRVCTLFVASWKQMEFGRVDTADRLSAGLTALLKGLVFSRGRKQRLCSGCGVRPLRFHYPVRSPSFWCPGSTSDHWRIRALREDTLIGRFHKDSTYMGMKAPFTVDSLEPVFVVPLGRSQYLGYLTRQECSCN